MSILDVALMPVRVARRLTDAVLPSAMPSTRQAVHETSSRARPAVVNGMPEGVPPVALRPEPQLPAPADWPFGEDFPRTCGTGRVAAGAAFWTDFIYDDHGAAGTRVEALAGRVVPPKGTYIYPEGDSAGNGADIFRAAVGLTDTHTWWRVDWNTLVDPAVPVALFGIDTGSGRATRRQWPADAGVSSSPIDKALLISGAGAWLIDLTTNSTSEVGHRVDEQARSFVAHLPRTLVEPAGTWTVRLVAGLANEAGDGFADVDARHGSQFGQPNVYNVAFRGCDQEAVHHNFWSDRAQAEALADGDISDFALAVCWADLAAGVTTEEPIVTGPSTRWYVSSVELGQGVAQTGLLATAPHFLGRVQPYSVRLPANYEPGRALPMTLLLHSVAMGQNQFAAVDRRLLDRMSDERDAVVVSPLGRGPACWYLDEGEVDVWEVWARAAEQLGTDPDRTVIAGYSMGGYAAYRLGLTYPAVFAQAVVLAGPPTCGVRVLPGLDLPADSDRDSHCAREGETWPLLRNARWLPFVIAHGALDEFVPMASVAQQVFKLDRLGYRYHLTAYPAEDHVALALQGKFDDAVTHLITEPRRGDPGHISFSWYPQLEREDLGIGPHRVWWISGLRAAERVRSERGALATVEAHSHARPDRRVRARRRVGLVLNFKPMPGVYIEQAWQPAARREARPHMTLELTGVAALTIDVARAGLAALPDSTIAVTTDGPVEITLEGLPSSTDTVETLPEGRHRISVANILDSAEQPLRQRDSRSP
ncbi:peptidase [Mycolicibacterium moriokaense]|nr:peptidase [Mycolicibacterium moriokaense]